MYICFCKCKQCVTSTKNICIAWLHQKHAQGGTYCPPLNAMQSGAHVGHYWSLNKGHHGNPVLKLSSYTPEDSYRTWQKCLEDDFPCQGYIFSFHGNFPGPTVQWALETVVRHLVAANRSLAGDWRCLGCPRQPTIDCTPCASTSVWLTVWGSERVPAHDTRED